MAKNYPTGGWGYRWVGDADRGYGRKQPGGFFYNILPFMELKSVHDLSKGDTHYSAGAKQGAKYMNQIPLPVFTCPTRRAPSLNPAIANVPDGLSIINSAPIIANQDVLYHSDYKANAGSANYCTTHGATSDCYWNQGPGDWAAAENGTGFKASAQNNDGISFQHSLVTIKDIVDGTAHTYLAGEKYMNPDFYFTGTDFSEDQPFLGADDYDLCGWTFLQPKRDRRGVYDNSNASPFGSAHASTFNMVFCDSSVTAVSFDIDPLILKRTSCRNDRKFGL